jgi:hypothetical protein
MKFTPKQEEAIELVRTEKYNFILYGGAIRGGKTIWGLTTLLILCELFPNSRWAVIRENSERLRKTTVPSFQKLESCGKLRQSPYEYTHHNGSVILFIGENYDRDKELDAFKGLEVNGFLFEEINECQEQTLDKAFERAGTWIIKDTDIQPKPIILATCNPSHGWIKERIYDKWVNGTLPEAWAYVPAKITDNPYLPKEYIENLKNLPKYAYAVFVDGNWDIQLKTGGEFLKSFELDQHVKPVKVDINNVIHISIDSNVLPYIAISAWQIEKEQQVNFTKYNCVQVEELLAKDPINTARKSALNVSKWLKNIGYNDKIMVYGDPTTKNSNNIDDDKKSFFDLFTETLKNESFYVQDKMSRSNTSVSAMGDFVNAVFEGNVKEMSITIGEHCKESINDYIETKQDKDGGILKKRVTDPKTKTSYEPNGHITDNLKDFICQAFAPEFRNFKKKFNDIAPIIGYKRRVI